MLPFNSGILLEISVSLGWPYGTLKLEAVLLPVSIVLVLSLLCKPLRRFCLPKEKALLSFVAGSC